MKKIITVCSIAFLMLGTNAKAQLQQGNFLVGGDIANFRLGLNKGGLFNINLSPKLAFFVQNNLALGAYVNFDLITSKGGGTDIDYGIGALARYYVSGANIDVLGRSRLFFEGTVGINGTNPSSGENTNGLGISIGPGLAHFITSNVALEGLVKYSGIIGFGTRTTSSDLLLGIGLQVYLPSGLGKSKQLMRTKQPQ
jgi:hypothetical protein